MDTRQVPAPYSSGRKLAQRGHPGPWPHMRGKSEGSSSRALSQGGASSGLRDLGSSLGQCHHPRKLDTRAQSAAGPHSLRQNEMPAPGCCPAPPRPAQQPPLASTFPISAQSMGEALPREPVMVQASPEPSQPASIPSVAYSACGPSQSWPGEGPDRLPGSHPPAHRAHQALPPQPLPSGPRPKPAAAQQLWSRLGMPAKPPSQMPHSWPGSLCCPRKPPTALGHSGSLTCPQAPAASLRPCGQLFGLPRPRPGVRRASPAQWCWCPGCLGHHGGHEPLHPRALPHPSPEPPGPRSFDSPSVRPTEGPDGGSQPWAPAQTRTWQPPSVLT